MVKGGRDHLDRSAMHLLHRAGQCAADIFASEARTSGLTPRQFAVLLLAGLLFRKPVLELLFGPVFTLTEEGWRKLTLRWTAFFFAMAVVNELVWRNFSTDAWVSFKAFGFLPLTFLFALAQVPLLQRHGEPPAADPEAEKRT